MNQVPGRRPLGRTVGEVTGQHEIEARAARGRSQTGEPLLELDIALHGRRFEASYFAVRDDRGELLAVGKAMIDVTARRRAEAARRAPAGRDAALAGAVTVADVAAVAIEQAGLALDASAAVLLLLDAERARLQIITDNGLGRAARAALAARSTLAEPMPATDAARTGRPSSSPTRPTLLERYPGLAGAPYPRAGAYAALCRWSPTGARSACSRSASRARSRSTSTSAAC